MALNPNWPVMEYAWGPSWNANGGTVPSGPFVDVTDRSRTTAAVQRGRQYELDQVRAAEYTHTWANTDGLLDPTNTAGPWYGHIAPFQPVRIRAQWPPTANMLTQVQATGGDLGGFTAGAIPSAAAVTSDTDGSGGTITASGTAWQGATVLQFSVPSGTVANKRICSTNQVAVKPGATYTVQLRVRDVTAATTLQVKAYFGFYTAGTATVTSTVYGSSGTLTGSTSASWTQITVTATAPSTAAGMDVGVVVAATAGATCTVQADGWQLEKGASASTWVQPGVTYPLYAGFLERLPSSWTFSGTYGLTQPTATDSFALLSQIVLKDPLTVEINARNPRFLYTLGDPQSTSTFADSAGKQRSAIVSASKAGAGSLTSGNQITSGTPGGTYLGSTGTVVSLANPDPNVAGYTATTFISLGAAGITGPTTTPWTRMIAFRYTGPAQSPGSDAYLMSAFDSKSNGLPSGSALTVRVESSAQNIRVLMSGPTGAGSDMFGPAIGVADGNWHLAIFGHDPANTKAFVSVDGTITTYSSVGASSAPTNLISDNIGSLIYPTSGNDAQSNFVGDISYVAEFPSYLSSTDITTVYNAWKSAFSGESTNARYSRILAWAGYSGPKSLQNGLTTSTGPANVGGQDALSALQAVVDTESGSHYAARDGTVTFKARSDRYNSLVPAYVFGERTDLGELPAEDVALDYDAAHIANQVTITQASSSQQFTATDATSAANYFPRSFSRTVNASSSTECLDAANYLLSRYKNPAVRVSSVRLHPSANPSALWPVCLSLELGTRIRVMRRPPSPAAAIQADVFVENISWEFTDQGDAWVTLQCNPVDLTPYALFASFHTTLSGSPASGVTTITINAGADSTNPANTQIGQGQQLVLGLGTANQETVTVLSVGATSPGWTTAVITLQAATTKSHTGGDIVCEPLPAGVTSATTYDGTTFSNNTAFAY